MTRRSTRRGSSSQQSHMARRKYAFDEADKLKALLWCDRHCCLCGKAAGIGIEVAHFVILSHLLHIAFIKVSGVCPNVGFEIKNIGTTYPVRARISVTLAQGSRIPGTVVRWSL